MDERERFEGLLLVLDELVEANHHVPIYVEGKRDVAALRALGCQGRVAPVHNGQTLWALVEESARNGREAIVLTDWDRKGESLRDQLVTAFQANGVRVDATFHDRLRDAVSLKLKDVESLANYVENGLARFLKVTLEDRARGLARP